MGERTLALQNAMSALKLGVIDWFQFLEICRTFEQVVSQGSDDSCLSRSDLQATALSRAHALPSKSRYVA